MSSRGAKRRGDLVNSSEEIATPFQGSQWHCKNIYCVYINKQKYFSLVSYFKLYEGIYKEFYTPVWKRVRRYGEITNLDYSRIEFAADARHRVCGWKKWGQAPFSAVMSSSWECSLSYKMGPVPVFFSNQLSRIWKCFHTQVQRKDKLVYRKNKLLWINQARQYKRNLDTFSGIVSIFRSERYFFFAFHSPEPKSPIWTSPDIVSPSIFPV